MPTKMLGPPLWKSSAIPEDLKNTLALRDWNQVSPCQELPRHFYNVTIWLFPQKLDERKLIYSPRPLSSSDLPSYKCTTSNLRKKKEKTVKTPWAPRTGVSLKLAWAGETGTGTDLPNQSQKEKWSIFVREKRKPYWEILTPAHQWTPVACHVAGVGETQPDISTKSSPAPIIISLW